MAHPCLANNRFHKGKQQENDPAFVAELAKLGDIGVNDAFSDEHPTGHKRRPGLDNKLQASGATKQSNKKKNTEPTDKESHQHRCTSGSMQAELEFDAQARRWRQRDQGPVIADALGGARTDKVFQPSDRSLEKPRQQGSMRCSVGGRVWPKHLPECPGVGNRKVVAEKDSRRRRCAFVE